MNFIQLFKTTALIVLVGFTSTTDALVTSAENIQPQQTSEQFATALIGSLNQQNREDLLMMSADTLQFGLEYGAWDGYWEDVKLEEALDYLIMRSEGGLVSAEILPDEPAWFLNERNPLRDLLPAQTLATVLLVRGWDGNSDAEALLFIAPDGDNFELVAIVYTTTGLTRSNRY